ncbi:MAG: DUF1345 domain-containing protein [Sphingomicrobium sp.]
MFGGEFAINKIAPARFVLFILVLVIGVGLTAWLWKPLEGVMVGFDAAAFLFLASCFPLLDDDVTEMRRHSKENDANRATLLGITVAVTTVILISVGAIISKSGGLQGLEVLMIVTTLVLAWLFGNVIYALHYAHLFYHSAKDRRGDSGGIEFPGTKQPNYWDFVYFAFTLGMTFQTSDCSITSRSIRKAAIGHCMAAFVFNLGVLAFAINALGSS